MNADDAAQLIADAIPRMRGVWADLGAGDGTFTRALLQLLDPGSRIYAVDRDGRALARWTQRVAEVLAVTADFTKPFEVPGLGDQRLDGMLFANSLHFVSEPAAVVRRLAGLLRPGGRVVIVEYDRRGPNRWVPHPIPRSSLPDLMASAGLPSPSITATMSSAYGGDLYAAFSETGVTEGAGP